MAKKPVTDLPEVTDPLENVDELLRAHGGLLGGGAGAPPIAESGMRLGSSLLRSSTVLISAALQTAVEKAFKAAIREEFRHFSEDEYNKYWKNTKKSWGNPSPHNIKTLFFRIGYSDVLDGLSWQGLQNVSMVKKLDKINQIRNRVAHGQPLTLNGKPFRLTKPTVTNWRRFAGVFVDKFQPHVLKKYQT